MGTAAPSTDLVRAALAALRDGPEEGETVVETGGAYAGGSRVAIRIRRRGRRYDLADDGAAVEAAGRPRGWLAVAERVVAQEGMNVNRAGVVFVPAVEGRDLASLALRLGAASLAVHHELLDHE